MDYLQIIRPLDPKQNTKDAVDGHVRALKKLQTDNDLVLLVISSLNRQNYLTPVDFESFKESGGIEYTADVIWGLQLQIMNGDLFDKKDKLKEKREKVKAAKLENPRKIELVCLKNRYGKSSYSCGFKYYPQFDYFVPQTDFDGFVDGADLSDVRLFYNHDLSKVPLARTPRTMQLTLTPAGLEMKAALPNTEEARAVYEAVKRRDLSGMSFAFTVTDGGSRYDPQTNTRTITKIAKVLECSVVPFPAYPTASVEARNERSAGLKTLAERKQAKRLINQILKVRF